MKSSKSQSSFHFGLITLCLTITVSACSGSRTSEGSSDYVAGDPMAIEPNPSDGILGRPAGMGQGSGSGSSGGNMTTSGGSTSGISGGSSGTTAANTTSGGDTSGGDTSGGDTSGGDTSGGDTSGGDTSGGDTSDSVPGAVPLDSSSEFTINYPGDITSIDLSGVAVDQVFSSQLNEYTATASYLTSTVGVSINSESPILVALTGSNNALTVQSESSEDRFTFEISREDVSRFVELAYLKDSEGVQNGEFGSALAIDGDRIAVLGRSVENRVTIFRREGAAWTLETVLRVSGNSVDLHQGTLVVGDTTASGRDIEGFGVGTVHVYTLQDSGWQLQISLAAQHPGEGDHFGHAVSIFGDTLAVGAPRESSRSTGINNNAEDNSALDAGAVYVFVRNSADQWRQQAYIKGVATQGGDKFGISVDLHGERLAVGAIGEESNAAGVNGNQNDNGLYASGAAYIFRSINGDWSQEAFIKPLKPGSNDLFGSTVVLSGSRLAVGAIGEDSGMDPDDASEGELNSGAVYVFESTNNLWQQKAVLKASHAGDSDAFGGSLALDGNTLVVGAQYEDSSARTFNGNSVDNSANNSGAVYVFNLMSGNWRQVLYIHASNADAGDHFSGSGAIALQAGSLVVGATGESSPSRLNNLGHSDNSMARAGAAYVYR